LLPGLLNSTASILSQVLARQGLNKLLKKWKKLTVLLCLLAAVLHSVWEASGWLYVMDLSNHRSFNIVEASSKSRNESQSVNLMIPDSIQHSRLYFEFVLFIISQQVIILSIGLTLILERCIEELSGRMTKLTNNLDIQKAVLTSQKDVGAELVNLQKFYFAILYFMQKINQLFSWIHSLIYLLDFVTCMGYVMGLIAGESNLPMFYFCFFISIVIYGAYATILFLPLIWVMRK
jgi:hypothetical protein